MAEFDWSKYEEKKPGFEWDKYREPETKQPETPSNYREMLMSAIKDAAKGGSIGLIQGLSDVGANIAQFPGDVYSYATGKESYRAPKPNFRESIPESFIGSGAGEVGEFIAPIALPGLGAEAAGTKLLPRLLAGAGFGAAESENRPLGALLGGGLGIARELPIRKGVGARYLNQVEKALKERGAGEFNLPEEIFNDIENNKFLTDTAANRKLIERAKKGKYKDLKEALIADLIKFIKPLRDRREQIAKDSKKVLKILSKGGDAARKVAEKKMEIVRKAIGVR